MDDELFARVSIKWAARRFGLNGVTSVIFENGSFDGCETCGYGAYPIGVRIVLEAGGEKYEEVDYAPELMRELVAIAAEGA